MHHSFSGCNTVYQGFLFYAGSYHHAIIKRLIFWKQFRTPLLFNLDEPPISTCLHAFSDLSSQQIFFFLVPVAPLQLARHTHAIPRFANPVLLLALTVASVGVPILKRCQTMEELEGVAASFHLCVFPGARGPFCYNLVVDHDGCYGGWKTTRNDGWNFAGHDAVVGAAEGEGEEVVEVGLSYGIEHQNVFKTEEEGTHRRMIVGISVIYIHVLEKPSNVFVEEALNLSKVEVRVNKEGADVRFHNIRESLESMSGNTILLAGLFKIPLELFLSKSNSLVPHWRPFQRLRDLARIHDSGSR